MALWLRGDWAAGALARRILRRHQRIAQHGGLADHHAAGAPGQEAAPIELRRRLRHIERARLLQLIALDLFLQVFAEVCMVLPRQDRKSTRLNSSHLGISYAVFCLKKKK